MPWNPSPCGYSGKGTDIVRNVVIALSGGIGAGKARLGEHLCAAIGGERVGFGAEVRRSAREAGADPDDVEVLQRIGQSLVLTQPTEFVRRVLAQRHRTDAPLIVEGVRHVEVLLELRDQTKGSAFRLFHVETPRDVRADRIVERHGVVRRLAARYEADVNEEQSARIVPQYADAVVDGRLPVSLQVARVTGFLGLGGRHAAP